jgi:hypothetical protein
MLSHRCIYLALAVAAVLAPERGWWTPVFWEEPTYLLSHFGAIVGVLLRSWLYDAILLAVHCLHVRPCIASGYCYYVHIHLVAGIIHNSFISWCCVNVVRTCLFCLNGCPRATTVSPVLFRSKKRSNDGRYGGHYAVFTTLSWFCIAVPAHAFHYSYIFTGDFLVHNILRAITTILPFLLRPLHAIPVPAPCCIQ